ncbi:MAG TPA: ABC transporter permease [Ilumatobacteraceae bacterium]|nr:ABC transporter permease [Ilumatobacteraceae bacterium]
MSVSPPSSRRLGRASAVIAVARTELARILRDRTGLFFIVVLPILVIVVIGASIGSVAGAARIGVLDLDGTPASERLIADLAASDRLEVVVVSEEETLAVDVRLDRLRAGLIVPAGHAERLAAGEVSELDMIVDPSRVTSTAARTSVAAVVDRHAAVVAAADFTTGRTDLPAAEASELAASLAESLPPVSVTTVEVGTGGIDSGSPFSYPAAANLVLFTFINTLTVGGVIVESRRLGVTRRLLAGPVSPGTIVAGYTASRFLVALLQGLIVVVAGALLFDVAWGDPLAVVLLVMLFSVAAAAAGVLIGAVARTPEQTVSIGVTLGIAMGMLGGALWPLQFVPDWLRQLGHITPHAWAMDGWVAVVFEDGGVGDIVVELAVLVAFGGLLTALAAVMLRRAVTRA